MDPSIVIFAIESAVKLGSKVYEVLVDETAERALVLPVGNLFQDVQVTVATQFFLRTENRHLIDTGGPYENFTPEEQRAAYRTLLDINRRLDDPAASFDQAIEIVTRLHAFEQLKAGFGAKSPARRILGTLIEIGIDYFATHPEALGKDSSARRVIESFISGLTDTDFAEASLAEIAGDLISAALRTFEKNVTLIDDDKRVQALLAGVARSLATDIDAATSPGVKLERKQLFKRIGSSILRGGATAFSENIELFLPSDEDSHNALERLVQSTLTQVLAGIQGKEDLFTNDSIELVFRSAIGAVGENADLFTKNQLLQQLIARTLKALTDTQGRKLFSDQTVAVILREALEVVHDNVETLVDPRKPQQQLLANAVAAMARSLATSLAGSGQIKDLLSARQLIELSRMVFQEVARHPEQLLGDNLDDDKRTALAQVIGSVASALGDDPTRLINGAGFIELVHIALQVAVSNADKLVNLESAKPETNVLFKAIQQVTLAVTEQGDPRKIVTRDVFVEIIRRVLPVVSANLDLLLDGGKPVADTVRAVLAFAGDTFKNRINGANLPLLIEQLLRLVLQRELNLAENTAVEKAVTEILRMA